MLVTLNYKAVHIADPRSAIEALLHEENFARVEVPEAAAGGSKSALLPSYHDEQQEHPRLAAALLNERHMNSIWNESISQACDMLSELTYDTINSKCGETDKTLAGLKKIALNVMGCIVFGAHRSWRGTDSQEPPVGLQTTLMESIHTVVFRGSSTSYVPPRILSLGVMPKTLKSVGVARLEVPLHLHDSIARARRSTGSPKTVVNHLVKTYGEDDKQDHGEVDGQDETCLPPKPSVTLTDEQLSAELSSLMTAGSDTIAITLAHAILALAVFPEWQDWITKSIDQATNLGYSSKYGACFPLMVRCLALMSETLRLFPPVPLLVRKTFAAHDINDIHIPADTMVKIDIAEMHTSDPFWEPEPFEFRPSRWLKEGIAPCEALIDGIPRGSFLAWSEGPKSCPGKKMAQVEFASVIQDIFGKFRVELVTGENEPLQEAKDRVMRDLKDGAFRRRMKESGPEGVVLKWVRR